jgi:hypothetical protein
MLARKLPTAIVLLEHEEIRYIEVSLPHPILHITGRLKELLSCYYTVNIIIKRCAVAQRPVRFSGALSEQCPNTAGFPPAAHATDAGLQGATINTLAGIG